MFRSQLPRLSRMVRACENTTASLAGVYTRVSSLSTTPSNSTVCLADTDKYIRGGDFARYIHTTRFVAAEETFKCPPFAESITEGDIRWLKNVGDAIAIDDVICEIETDKTAVPVMATVDGVLTSQLAEDGATVSPGTDIFTIDVGAAGGAAPAAAVEEAPAAAPAAAAAPPTPPASPQPSLAGSIPTQKPPIKSPSSKPVSSTKEFKPVGNTKVGAALLPSGGRTESRVKMNRMRLKIAQRLKDAQNTTAMLTTFNEIDMTNVMELRKSHQEAFVKKHGIKFGFMSAFVKASAWSLMDMPAVNGVIDGDEIVYRDYVDISVAVSTPKGLVVPVLRNCEQMNFAEIELGIAAMGLKAREGTLAIEDMDGGTFTISNGGVFGSMFGTPIINPPQSAILGMHGIFQRPVAINGEVKIRPMMYVALTYDHRLIDGREAVTFLRQVKSGVEDPRVLLLDV